MKKVALLAVVALAAAGCSKSQPTTEYEAGRVFQGYKDGGAAKANKVFRKSRVIAEGKVEAIYACYSVKNPDVGTESFDVVNLGEKSSKPNATLSSYSIKLVNVKEAEKDDSVTADFHTDQLASVSSVRVGTVIRVAGKLSYGLCLRNWQHALPYRMRNPEVTSSSASGRNPIARPGSTAGHSVNSGWKSGFCRFVAPASR